MNESNDGRNQPATSSGVVRYFVCGLVVIGCIGTLQSEIAPGRVGFLRFGRHQELTTGYLACENWNLAASLRWEMTDGLESEPSTSFFCVREDPSAPQFRQHSLLFLIPMIGWPAVTIPFPLISLIGLAIYRVDVARRQAMRASDS